MEQTCIWKKEGIKSVSDFFPLFVTLECTPQESPHSQSSFQAGFRPDIYFEVKIFLQFQRMSPFRHLQSTLFCNSLRCVFLSQQSGRWTGQEPHKNCPLTAHTTWTISTSVKWNKTTLSWTSASLIKHQAAPHPSLTIHECRRAKTRTELLSTKQAPEKFLTLSAVTLTLDPQENLTQFTFYWHWCGPWSMLYRSNYSSLRWVAFITD